MEYLVIFLPLIGSIITYFGKSFGNLFSQIFSCSMVFISAVISCFIFYDGLINDNYGNYLIFEWINSGNLNVNWSIKIDPLSSNDNGSNIRISFSSYLFNWVYES